MVIPVFLCVLLTQIVSQEVGREALGAVAHGRVVVRVSSEHQHRPAHDHRCVEVTEEAAVSQNGPAQTHTGGRHESSPEVKPNHFHCPLVAGWLRYGS